MPKVFMVDPGIKYITENMPPIFTYDLLPGALAKNITYLFLKACFGGENIHFYRTISHSEIDFIIKHNGLLWPVEVKFRNSVQRQCPPAIKRFADKYSTGQKLLITKDNLFFQKEENLLALPLYLLPFYTGR